jgi:hypothetical protein
MVDKDYVFARFTRDQTSSTDKREQLTIQRRGPGAGSRVVEVVHVRSAASTGKPSALRADPGVRAASWEDGFRTKPLMRAPGQTEAPLTEHAAPVGHVMPAREPTSATKPETQGPEALIAAYPTEGASSGRKATIRVRQVAAPFNPADGRANCMRCGYATEGAREKRGRSCPGWWCRSGRARGA